MVLLLATIHQADAQQAKVARVGVVHLGGSYYPMIDGLRDGLKQLGLQEGKQFLLENRDAKGDLKIVETVAKELEREKVNVIYALSALVARLVEQATVNVPIAFCSATDPVAYRLVESYPRPGGRLSGIHYLGVDLTGKRLEILKEIIPKLRRVITYCDSCGSATKLGPETARQLGIEVVVRHVTSPTELQAALEILRAGEADAYFYTTDAMVTGQAHLIINRANTLKLATMFHEETLVANGALASYGVNFHEVGRLSARYVQRILANTHPRDLPVESYHRLSMAINLRTAKQVGLMVPQSVLYRADKVFK